MSKPIRYYRPPFEDALATWKKLLQLNSFATDILWILEENLYFERDPFTEAGVKLGFQTQFTPQPADTAKVTYHHFAEADTRLVFYRLGASRGRSVCTLLCDEWFEERAEDEGYIRRDEWLVSFHPGLAEEIEEITDAQRWRGRMVHGRPLSAVDFCMTMSALHELKAHGRVLTPDERFGLKILRSMQEK
jgi:hypothetical protein